MFNDTTKSKAISILSYSLFIIILIAIPTVI